MKQFDYFNIFKQKTAMKKYSKIYPITDSEMDADYRLRPISAVMFFQDCFSRFMASEYLASFDMIRKNIIWIIADLDIGFMDELPFWSDDIRVEVWLSEVSGLRIYTDFVIYHNEKPFVRGVGCWFLLDANTRRPVPVSSVADKVGVVDELVMGKHHRMEFPESRKTVSEASYRINSDDIDFNGHANHKSYLNIAAKTLPADFRRKFRISRMSVRFQKECFLDDLLVCTVSEGASHDEIVYHIRKDGVDVCSGVSHWVPKGESTCIQNTELQIRPCR